MTKSVTQATRSTQEKREKKTYDGTLIPEGYVLAPVWLKRDFVNEASYIKSENLTTRKYAGITFLIGYVAVPPEKYEGLKQDCDEQINVYLKKHRAGRCIIGKKKDGSPKLCPKSNHCKGCIHKGEYERYNPEKDNNPEIIFSDLTEEVGVYDQYPCEQDNEPDEEKLARLLKHLETIDKRYCDIVTMKLAGVEMDEIFEKLQLKPSRGYQVVDECEQACRKFFGLYCGKKKKKK